MLLSFPATVSYTHLALKAKVKALEGENEQLSDRLGKAILEKEQNPHPIVLRCHKTEVIAGLQVIPILLNTTIGGESKAQGCANRGFVRTGHISNTGNGGTGMQTAGILSLIHIYLI